MTVLPARLFAPIGQFEYMAKHQKVKIGLFFSLQKGNKCNQIEIATANGRHKLSLHLNRNSIGMPIYDSTIAAEGKFLTEIHRSLRTAYKKAPFFEFYDYKLLPLLQNPHLGQSIQQSYEHILSLLDLKTEIEWVKEPPNFEPISAIRYNQVFMPGAAFEPNCSILDLVFNQGPLTEEYIKNGTIA